MAKYEINQVPRDVLETFLRTREELFSYDMSKLPLDFLVAYVQTHRCIFSEHVPDNQLGWLQLQVRQAAKVKLRTKLEVDAEIALTVRYHASRLDLTDRSTICKLYVLADEETEG